MKLSRFILTLQINDSTLSKPNKLYCDLVQKYCKMCGHQEVATKNDNPNYLFTMRYSCTTKFSNLYGIMATKSVQVKPIYK